MTGIKIWRNKWQVIVNGIIYSIEKAGRMPKEGRFSPR
jgi:hypothetical protein